MMPDQEQQKIAMFIAAFIALPLIAYGFLRLIYHLLS